MGIKLTMRFYPYDQKDVQKMVKTLKSARFVDGPMPGDTRFSVEFGDTEDYQKFMAWVSRGDRIARLQEKTRTRWKKLTLRLRKLLRIS